MYGYGDTIVLRLEGYYTKLAAKKASAAYASQQRWPSTFPLAAQFMTVFVDVLLVLFKSLGKIRLTIVTRNKV